MSFVRDPGVAFHSLVRSKGFAAIVVLTLALGIGANAAVAAVIWHLCRAGRRLTRRTA